MSRHTSREILDKMIEVAQVRRLVLDVLFGTPHTYDNATMNLRAELGAEFDRLANIEDELSAKWDVAFAAESAAWDAKHKVAS